MSGQDAEPEQDKESGIKVLPLAVGWTTYIRDEVEVVPALDVLIVTSEPLKEGAEGRVVLGTNGSKVGPRKGWFQRLHCVGCPDAPSLFE